MKLFFENDVFRVKTTKTISDTVPKAVKNKIKEECWSLFNDPRTPKGVKQCILNTMLTKTHSE